MAQGSKKSTKSLYVCTACGATFPKWSGQCGECQAWNVLEENLAPASGAASGRFSGYAGENAAGVVMLSEVGVEREQLNLYRLVFQEGRIVGIA